MCFYLALFKHIPSRKRGSRNLLLFIPLTFGLFLLRGNEDTPYDVCHCMAYPITKAKAEKMVLEANGTEVTDNPRPRVDVNGGIKPDI